MLVRDWMGGQGQPPAGGDNCTVQGWTEGSWPHAQSFPTKLSRGSYFIPWISNCGQIIRHKAIMCSFNLVHSSGMILAGTLPLGQWDTIVPITDGKPPTRCHREVCDENDGVIIQVMSSFKWVDYTLLETLIKNSLMAVSFWSILRHWYKWNSLMKTQWSISNCI